MADRADATNIRHSQNFLTSRRLVDRVLERSGISPEDLVLDVGAGPGRRTDFDPSLRSCSICRERPSRATTSSRLSRPLQTRRNSRVSTAITNWA